MFNADFFDTPLLDTRTTPHGISIYIATGFARGCEDKYKSRGCAHMDCLRWIKRNSYLPQGHQGLETVTIGKLGHNPIELDPELMAP
jgi:DNA polymerase epsilon subunit 1